MKRALVLFLVLGIVVGGFATAEAKKKKKKKPAPRVVTADYAPLSDGGQIILNVGAAPGASLTQVSFVPTTKERKVSIAMTDDSGLPARGRVTQAEADLSGIFCGKTDAPVSIAPGVEISVEVFSGVCGSGAAVGSEGTIKATFSP